MQITDYLYNVLGMFVYGFLASWFVGGFVTNIKNKKYYAVGWYIPLILLWIKCYIQFLLHM